jgi:hypothetical protein
MIKKSLNERVLSYLRRAKNQELILKYLRTLKYEFITHRELMKLWPKFWKVEPEFEDYSYMVRSSKTTKSGYDPRLVLGMKIVGQRTEKVLVFMDQSLIAIEIKPWHKKSLINFKKVTQKMKFDPAMTYRERRDWRNEHNKVKKSPKYKPSNFYLENKKYVQFLEAK